MKFSLLALSVFTVTQAFAPGAHRPRAFTPSTLLRVSTQDSTASSFTDSSARYEGDEKDMLDAVKLDAVVAKAKQHQHHELIEGSEYENVPTTGPATSSVTQVVRAPLEDVWKLASPFGGDDVTKWWHIYNSVELDGPDAIGVERSFKVGPRSTTEMLAERNDETHKLVYKLTSAKGYPTGYYGTTTVVSMKALGDNMTEVTWESWSNVHDLIKETVFKGQKGAYLNAIASLDAYFHPAVGKLDVTVKSASGLKGHSSPYVVVKIDENEPKETSEARSNGDPTFDETLNFNMHDKKGRVSIAVLDSKRGKDEVLGTAMVDLSMLVGSDSSKLLTLPLQGAADGATITASFDVSLDEYKVKVDEALGRVPAEGGFSIDKIKMMLSDLINKAFDAIIVYNMGKQDSMEYDRYSRSPQLDHVALENLPRSAKGLPFAQQLMPDKVGLIMQRLVEYAYAQADFAVLLKVLTMTGGDKWTAFWGQHYLKPTANTKNIKENFPKDQEQARQYLNGMSPTMISQVQSLSDIPDRIPIKNVQLGGEDLQSIIDRKGLFFCDYKHLAPLHNYKNMFFYAPYALMYKPKGSEELTVGAIQLDRRADANVYTDNRDETSESRWRFARLHLACADNQYHQFIFHLGYGHLAMEPHIVSIYNSFDDDHIISQLMTPHFKDTIGINFLARQTLVSEVEPITDRTFSPGTAQAMQLFLNAWEEYDFFDNNFVNDLKNRGFTEDKSDGVKDYYYREDGFKLWNAMGNYIGAVVDKKYPTDKDVENDEQIKKWVLETRSKDKADIPGFPNRIFSKALLVECLQTIMWNLSAAHSAVNFSQYDHLSYIPNRPNALFKAMPKGSPKDEIPDYDTKFKEEAMPPIASIGHFEVLFSWLLTTPPQVTLEKVNAMENIVPDAHKLFQKELAGIHEEIKTRNDKLAAEGKPNYPYLDPHRVEASIAI